MARSRKPISYAENSDSDGTPLSTEAGNPNGAPTKNGTRKRTRPASEESELSDDDDEDDAEVPLSKRAKTATTSSTSSTLTSSRQRNGKTNGVTNGKSKPTAKRKAPPSSSSSSLSSDDDDDDDAPLALKTIPSTSAPGKDSELSTESSDDDEAPLRATVAKAKVKAEKSSKKVNEEEAPSSFNYQPKEESDDGDESDNDDDDKPLAGVKGKKKATANGKAKPSRKPPAKKAKKAESSDSDSDVPIQRRKSTSSSKASKAKASKERKVKESSSTPAPTKKGKVKKEESGSPVKKSRKQRKEEEEAAEQEEIHRWWEQQEIQGDGTVKWQTLDHAGVLFPPPYQPLPKSVKMKYDGKDITLSPEGEEVAGFFAALLETDHAADATFRFNFFRDWLLVLKDHTSADSPKIKEFDKCDFRPMFLHFEAEKAAKKALSAADKKVLKEEREKLELPYKECVLDGRKEKVGNFRIEPPGLFRGRGEHPRKGCLKFRVAPEDIVINIGKEATTPIPNMAGTWGKIVHDQTVTWLANWKENVNGNFKYVFLAAGSSLKGQSDMAKFEKARELKKHVARIRQDYNVELKSKITADRQRATAMYFIDKLALRAGNEKGEDEADTVGCCSLRYEHVTLEPPNQLIFDFLGKDSIRYFNTVEVDAQVFKNMRIFKGDGKTEKDAIFDRVTTTSLNKHLQSYMKGLTAKVFRTYNASITFQQQLDANTRESMSEAEKLAAYHEANRMVAILCNHQKSVSKGFGASMEKMSDRLRGLKYQRMKLRHVLFSLDKKMKKKHKELDELESDIDDEFIEYWEEELKKKDIEKAKKKHDKTNEQRTKEDEKPEPESALKETIKRIEEEYEELAEERGKQDVNTQGFKDTDKVLAAITKMDERIHTFKVSMDVKDKGKDVSLGTSKINYLDPRITSAWCKKHDVDVKRLFSKTLMQKFPWAMEVDDEWKF